jgi:hypothetical protein
LPLRDVRPGAPYANEILEAIRDSRILVLVLSESSNKSSHVMREVERAVDGGIPIIPFRIEDVLPNGSLAYFLGAVHWLDAFTPPFEAHLRSLADTAHLLLQPDKEVDAASKVSSHKPAHSRPVVRSPARAPNRWPLVGVAICLVMLSLLANFVFFVGPPWPDRKKGALITVLVTLSTLAWCHATWRPKNPRFLSRVFGLLAGGLLATFLVLTALFVYDAPDARNQEASGFIRSAPVEELLKSDPSMTIDDVVRGSEDDPNQVWVPWTVAAVRLALLSSWLGMFACAAIAAAAIASPSQARATS